MNITEIIDSILVEGLDDWVAVDTLIWHSEECETNAGRPFRETFHEVLASMLELRLIEVGGLLDDGFVVRTGDPESVIRQLEQELDELDWDPKGAACWLRNTSAGDERARSRAAS